MNTDWNNVKDRFLNALLDDEEETAIQITREALNNGATPELFFEACITPVMKEVGERFERLEIFLPEMVVAAEIVQKLSDQVIKPLVESSPGEKFESKGKVLIATVEGDLHDIGKNMVLLMLSVNGFEVVDLGVNTSAQKIVEKAEQEGVDIIGMSSLLTSCLPFMKDVVELLKLKGLRDRYKVIIGGAAPTPEYAARIGVDAQGHTAAEAVAICKKLLSPSN